jgi:HD-like signal output (HDOD) protein
MMMTSTTSLTRQSILATAAQLPAAPQIMARLYTLLLDINSGLEAIAALLKRDIALTTRIIRIANSPALGGGGVGSIDEALQRVGFGEVYRLVGVAANTGLTDRPLVCYGYSAERFRKHNLLSALVAERLAQRLGQDTRAAYTAGLLRLIGQLLLDLSGRASLPAHETFPQSGGTKVAIWEKATFGLDHYAVAGVLLTGWGFPEEIVSAVEHGHSAGGAMHPMASLIDLTDNIVRFAGHGLDGEETEWGVPQEKLAAVNLTMDDIVLIKDCALEQLKALESAS